MPVFMIRGQGSGLRTDKVYFRLPTAQELAAVLHEELLKYGFSRAGAPKKLWVRVEAVETVGDVGATMPVLPEDGLKVEGELSQEDVDTLGLVDQTERVMVESDTALIETSGQGTVTLPDDPAHPSNQL